MAAAARRAGMTEADVLDPAVARSAWRGTAAVRLNAGGVRPPWYKTPLPAGRQAQTRVGRPGRVRDAAATAAASSGGEQR